MQRSEPAKPSLQCGILGYGLQSHRFHGIVKMNCWFSCRKSVGDESAVSCSKVQKTMFNTHSNTKSSEEIREKPRTFMFSTIVNLACVVVGYPTTAHGLGSLKRGISWFESRPVNG